MVSALLIALVLAVLQLSFAVHVRHVLQASAWEGARYASYANTTLSDGVGLTRVLITEGVGAGYAKDVSAQSVGVAGRPGVEVRVLAPLPQLGMWSVSGQLRVRAAVPYELPG